MSQGKNSVVDSNIILVKWRHDRASFKKVKNDMQQGFESLKKYPSQVLKEQKKSEKAMLDSMGLQEKQAKVSKKQSDTEKKQSAAVAKAVKAAEKLKSVAVRKNAKVEADRYKLVQRASDLSQREQLDLLQSMGRLGTEFKDNKISAAMYSAKLSELTKKTSLLVREQKKLKNPHQQHLSSLTDNTAKSLVSDRLGDSMRDHVKTAAKTSVVGVGVGGVAAIAAMKQSTDYALELKKQATLAGLNVEEFQKLAYSYEKVGLSADQAADHSKDLLDRLGDFQRQFKIDGKGAGGFEDVAETLKIPRNVIANWKTGSDALTAIFNNKIFNNDKAAQTFILETLGNDLTAVQDLYKNSAQELHKYQNEYNNLGLGLSKVDIDNLVALKQSLISVNSQASNIKNSFTLGFFGDTTQDVEKIKEINEGLKVLNGLASGIGSALSSGLSAVGNLKTEYYDPIKKTIHSFTNDEDSTPQLFKKDSKTGKSPMQAVNDTSASDFVVDMYQVFKGLMPDQFSKFEQTRSRESVALLNPPNSNFYNYIQPTLPDNIQHSQYQQQQQQGSQRVQVDVNQKPLELSLKTDNNALFELVDDRASNIVTNTFNNQQQRLTRFRE